jgi:Protein of unknown function (DUF2924)
MPRVKVGADQRPVEIEIARLRDLVLGELRARWHTVFRRRAPSSLPRHLLFCVLAYRAQADALGDLDSDCQRILDRADSLKAAGDQMRKLNDVLSTLNGADAVRRRITAHGAGREDASSSGALLDAGGGNFAIHADAFGRTAQDYRIVW